MNRGLVSNYCSRAAFRPFGTIARKSIRASMEKGVEKGFEEDSKLENSSIVDSDWGDEARGQYYIILCVYIYMYAIQFSSTHTYNVYICIYIYIL